MINRRTFLAGLMASAAAPALPGLFPLEPQTFAVSQWSNNLTDTGYLTDEAMEWLAASIQQTQSIILEQRLFW